MCYTDTDSIMYGMSKPFNQIAKPELSDEYWSHIHPQWFVADPNSIDAKTPGIPRFLRVIVIK